MSATLSSIDRLDSERILHDLHKTGVAPCAVQVFEQIDSTNAWLLQQCRAGAELPLACIADSQNAGRGRRGRIWHSPASSNIYMSLGWEFQHSTAELGAFSLLIGVALVRVLKQIGIPQAKLKWPNDVLVENRKLAGILIETQNRQDGGLAVVIGIGLNVHMADAERAQIDQTCTDVCEWLSAACDRNQLVALLLAECIGVCQGFPQNSAELLAEYRRDYDALKQQTVTIRRDNGLQQTALSLGVAADGALQVQIDGVEQRLMAADVSLRCAT
jgi:BirA family transcriptional regulator, biotin operon repressor / biotin---[acetyl-CoA-carboxylase] ligase